MTSTSATGAEAIEKITTTENQTLFLKNLDEIIVETDKDTNKIYEGDTTIDLFNLFRKCFFYYNLIERFVDSYDMRLSLPVDTEDKKTEDIDKIKKKRESFASFVKKYKNLTEIVKLIESSSAKDNKLQNLMNECKIELTGEYGAVPSRVNELNKMLSETIVKHLTQLFKDRQTAIAAKSSSIVRVYYPDPALATTTPGSKKSKKKIREDVIKIDYNNTECTDKFNCALHQTMLRTDDYLKSVLNTFNNVPNPIMQKGKQVYTSYFDDPKEPYYLVWDDDKTYGREKYNLESIKKSGGAKRNYTKKKYK
jgi:hypothetical protein